MQVETVTRFIILEGVECPALKTRYDIKVNGRRQAIITLGSM
jgi:hypothetical protein